MHQEREELVKRVFPQLRQLCESRGITFVDVDLRWGITDEAVSEGKVLEHCLDEIDRCRPFFIGLLGQRLGWVPPSIPPHLARRHPWLLEDPGRSVTEIEMLYGALLDPARATHAYFYLRDPAFCDALPPERRSEFVEPQSARSAHGRSRSVQLRRLKERVRSSGVQRTEGFSDAVQLGSLVLRDLKECIDIIAPAEHVPDWLEQQGSAHESYAEIRHQYYVQPPGLFDSLDEHCKGSGPPLIVLGPSGRGKSALLANWSSRVRETGEIPVVRHFVGASPASGQLPQVLRRIMAELQRELGIEAEIPPSDDELPSAFGNWLHLAAASGCFVLIIDAVDELEDRGGARELSWLPEQLPAGVRLLVSTKPGQVANRLAVRGWPTLGVPPLRRSQQAHIVGEVLRAAGKTLSDEQLQRLLDEPLMTNALFLRTLLEEIRVFGDHEGLTCRIEHYLEAPSVEALFDRVLLRYESDYDAHRAGLVRDAMRLIWASRHGLSEPELLELLGEANGAGLPRAYWLALRTAAATMFVDRSGLVGFAHGYGRDAVERRYLQHDEDMKATRRVLADYFEVEPRRNSSRGTGELPWQLSRLGDWTRLRQLLSVGDFFASLWQTRQWDARAYWAQLVEQGHLPTEAYSPLLESPGLAPYRVLWSVGSVLLHLGFAEPSVRLRRLLVQRDREEGDEDALKSSIGDLAIALEAINELDEAMDLLREQEAISRRIGAHIEVHNARLNRAGLLHLRGELKAAFALQQEAVDVFRAHGERESLRIALGNQVLIHADRGEWEAAAVKLDEEERLCRELDDQAGIARCIDERGHHCVHRRELDSALQFHRDAEVIYRRIGDRRGLARCLNSQGAVLGRMERFDEALQVHRVEESISHEMGDERGVMASLGNQALILDRLGRDDEACAYLDRAEPMAVRLDDPEMLHRIFGQRAQVCMRQERFVDALELVEKKEVICRRLGVVNSLQIALSWKGQLLASMERYEDARVAHAEEAELCRKVEAYLDEASALRDLGQAFVQLARFDEGLECYEHAEQISREHADHDGLARALMLQSFAATTMGQLPAARGLAHRAGQLVISHGLDDLCEPLEDLLEMINGPSE